MDIYELYFNWLVSEIKLDSRYGINHYNLLKALHNRNFEYFNRMDENRYHDGIDLRYHFGNDAGIPSDEIAELLDIRECSVLEMMVALIIRIDNMITYEPKDEIKTDIFISMLKSLQINEQTNNIINYDFVEQALFNFMHHQYEPNGFGGLITLKNPREDMRYVDFWTQVMWYVTEKLGGYSIL